MKNYLKNQIKNIPMMLLLIVLFYSITTFSASSPLTAGEVTFDNDNTPLLADNVQGAVNEIFQHTTDYNEIKTTIGNSTLTTTSQNLNGAINEVNDKFPISIANGGTGATTAAAAITNLGAQAALSVESTTVTGYGMTLNLYRYGKIVTATLLSSNHPNADIAEGTTIFTIPSGYRPKNTINIVGTSGSWSSSGWKMFQFLNSGVVQCHGDLTNNNATAFSVTYISA